MKNVDTFFYLVHLCQVKMIRNSEQENGLVSLCKNYTKLSFSSYGQ